MRIRKPGVVWIVIVCLLAVAGCKKADDSTGGQSVTEKPEVTKPLEEEKTENPEVTKPVEEENQENPEVTKPAEGENQENPEVTKPAEEIKPVEETRPVEGESFVGLFWTRETDVDTEYLHFSPKGDYSYYCACGNPVNDSDLCESYSYNPDTGTISLQCFAVTDSMVTEITVVKCDGEILVLDFDGDIRTFVKENN